MPATLHPDTETPLRDELILLLDFPKRAENAALVSADSIEASGKAMRRALRLHGRASFNSIKAADSMNASMRPARPTLAACMQALQWLRPRCPDLVQPHQNCRMKRSLIGSARRFNPSVSTHL